MPQGSQKTSIYKVHNRQHDPGPLALMCYRVVSGFFKHHETSQSSLVTVLHLYVYTLGTFKMVSHLTVYHGKLPAKTLFLKQNQTEEVYWWPFSFDLQSTN